jgi:hypothetical protein
MAAIVSVGDNFVKVLIEKGDVSFLSELIDVYSLVPLLSVAYHTRLD